VWMLGITEVGHLFMRLQQHVTLVASICCLREVLFIVLAMSYMEMMFQTCLTNSQYTTPVVRMWFA